MHLTVGRRLTIRTGEYESVILHAEFGVTHRDFAESDTSLEQLTDDQRDLLADRMQGFVKAQLDAALGDDIVDAANVADRKSFVHDILPPPAAKDASSARTARRRSPRRST